MFMPMRPGAVQGGPVFPLRQPLPSPGGRPDAMLRAISGPATQLFRPTGRLDFVCSSSHCACRGDADCNDMFTAGLCGPDAICINGVCICRRR